MARYFNDINSGLWIVKLGPKIEKGSMTAPGQRSLPNGDIAYEFVFPDSLKEILALQRRYGQKTAG